jgi:HEAT repeat protein
MRFDYSYGATYDLGAVHKFAVTCRFAAVPAAPVKAAPVKPYVETPADRSSRLLDDLYGADRERAEAAAEALAVLNNPGVMEHFAALLSSGKTRWKMVALRGLAASEDPKAPELLAGALRAQEREVRLKAAQALAVRGGQAQLRLLEESLKREEEDEVKGALIQALVKIKAR